MYIQDWEEIADAAVSSALRMRLKKSDNEILKTQGELEPIKDVTKLKKRIAHLVERLTNKDPADSGSGNEETPYYFLKNLLFFFFSCKFLSIPNRSRRYSRDGPGYSGDEGT